MVSMNMLGSSSASAMVRRETTPAGAIRVGVGEAVGKGEGEWYRLLLRTLRGRYGLAVLLCLLSLSFGVWAGWGHGRVSYHSEGLVRIVYSKPEISTRTDISEPLTAYDRFMRTQVLLLGSHRVAKAALQEPVWLETGRGSGPEVLDDFAHRLRVEHPAETQDLRVCFDGPEPGTVAAAVQATVGAYSKIYQNEEGRLQDQRMDELAKRERELAGEVTRVLTRMAQVGSDLDDRHTAAAAEVATLSAKLTELRLAIVLAGPEPAHGVARELSVSELALIDAGMRALLTEQGKAQDEVETLRRGSLEDQHPRMRAAKAKLAQSNKQVADYAAELRQSPVAQQLYPQFLGAVSRSDLGQQVKAVSGMQEKALQTLAGINGQRSEMAMLQGQANRARGELDQVRSREDMLRVESALGGRLEVVSAGEVPLRPVEDSRMKWAGMGGLAGLGAPLGLMLLLGLVGRKYRYADEMSEDLETQKGIVLLGILPTVPKKAASAERAADVAQSLHQIRVRLQSGRGPGSRVLLVTSTGMGEGKTSLTAGLGFSYKAAGLRTLLVDCDLVGQSLTRGFDAHGKAGLHEALATGHLNGYVQTVAPGLHLLPVGGARPVDACAISAPGVRALLAEAREHYDVVLIDSGPLLGSMEAAVLAPLVDEVVLIAARGQQPRNVQRTLRQLHMLGAPVAGFVFNRAAGVDFASSCGYAWSTSASAEAAVPAKIEATWHLGPLVDAIRQFMPDATVARSIVDAGHRSGTQVEVTPR